MGVRFHRRVSVLPGVHLNFSGSGLSLNIGPPGANITLGGHHGGSVNLGLPGTGLSLRTPLSNFLDSPDPNPPAPPLPPPAIKKPMVGIQSAEIETLTSPALAPLKELIISAREQRAEADLEIDRLEKTLFDCRSALEKFERDRHNFAVKIKTIQGSWFRFLRNRSLISAQVSLEECERKIGDANSLLGRMQTAHKSRTAARDSLWVDTEFHLTAKALAAWREVERTFDDLSRSDAIWDVTAKRMKNKGDERSSATSVIERKATALSRGDIPVIESEFQALVWRNTNGDDLYLYPGFLVAFRSSGTFALIDLLQVEIDFGYVDFIEEERSPTDAQQVGSTWQYANKDGSRDRRFQDNREIPILRYARFVWKSDTGLNEEYQISNFDASLAFIKAFVDFGPTVLKP